MPLTLVNSSSRYLEPNHISGRELAAKLGVAASTLNRILKGTKTGYRVTAERIMRRLPPVLPIVGRSRTPATSSYERPTGGRPTRAAAGWSRVTTGGRRTRPRDFEDRF
jgi:hypothetical protein